MRAGERLGPYEIVALLGAGGMGEVYQPGGVGRGLTIDERCCALLKGKGPLTLAVHRL